MKKIYTDRVVAATLLALWMLLLMYKVLPHATPEGLISAGEGCASLSVGQAIAAIIVISIIPAGIGYIAKRG